MRGIDGHPADRTVTRAHEGLAEYPGIHLLVQAKTALARSGSPDKGTRSSMNSSGGGYDDVAGIWTSGMDQQVVDAIKAAGKDSCR